MRIALALLLTLTFAFGLRAEEPKPLKVLWCSGGGAHDYKGLTPLLTEGIKKYANVEFEIVWDFSGWSEKTYADKYDAVVHFHTYHDKTAKAAVENMPAAIKAGKPALFIHGSLHTWREFEADRDPYCEAIGLTSSKHDKFSPMATKKVVDHPITRFWADDWKTPGDELYQNIKFWPNATALMTAFSETSKKDHVVTWINQYGKGRVAGTSLGHDLKTAGQECYQHLLANELLWICDKLDADGKPKAGYGPAK